MSAVFISHASEDKDVFVRPLVRALKHCGIQVWYDEFTLRPGDSLRRSIDKGLVECSAGIVVLSHAFFQKEWPQRELDALFTAETFGKSRLIPIWHGLTAKDVAEVSALMADRVAINSKLGADEVASQLADLLPNETILTGTFLAEKIENFQNADIYELEYLRAGCEYRFLKIQAFYEQYTEVLYPMLDEHRESGIEAMADEIDHKLNLEQRRLQKKYDIPENVYIGFMEPIKEESLPWFINAIGNWVSGTLEEGECNEFLFQLDEYLDFDYFYVLVNIPNFSISRAQRPLFDKAILAVGKWFANDESDIDDICDELRMLDVVK